MRREEFSISNHQAMFEFLDTCEYGVLSLLEETSRPYGVPLNFASWREGIVFHGAKEGKKQAIISLNPQAHFTVVKPYALIPSYFSHTSLACPATQFFGSVMLEGTIKCIENMEEKADALTALMRKLQPEGRYADITPSNQAYTKMLTQTNIFYMPIEHSSFKLKIGQNLTQERKKLLIEELEKRGTMLDQETLKLIRQ